MVLARVAAFHKAELRPFGHETGLKRVLWSLQGSKKRKNGGPKVGILYSPWGFLLFVLFWPMDSKFYINLVGISK